MGDATDVVDQGEGYLAVVAHELRTPLSAILLACGTLRRAAEFGMPSAREMTALLDVIDGQGRRMGRLIDDLLIAARIDHELITVELMAHEVRPILTAAAEAAPVSGSPTIVDCDADLLVLTDAYLLERAVTNLVVNAAVHGGPPVVMTAVRSHSTVDITVRDHGTGVLPSEVDQLFDRFSGLARGRAGSNGLGLSIVRDLVTTLRGEVAYEPADPGALFTVRVPAAARAVLARPG